MTEVSGWHGGISRGGAAGESRGYRIAQEVERTAAATRPNYSKQTLFAIDQLGKALSSGLPEGFRSA